MQMLLNILQERNLPICISKDGKPVAEVVSLAALPTPDPKLRVRFNVRPDELTTAEDWREAGI